MTKPTTPLRQRMIEDMTLRNMSPMTQAAYVRSVANFAAHYQTSPDKAAAADDDATPPPCPCCGGRMRVVEAFERGSAPRSVSLIVRLDTS